MLRLKKQNERKTRGRTSVAAAIPLAAACLLWLWPSSGIAASFTATLDRDAITLGESATLSLTFSDAGIQGTPGLPPIDGLDITYIGPETKSQIDFTSGSSSTTVTHKFAVTPKHDGDFVIPALQVQVGGERLSSQPLKLQVLKPGAPPPQAIASGNQLAFLKLTIPKKEAYVGEMITAQLDLYLQDKIQNIGGFQITSFPADGFAVGKWVEGGRRRVQVGGSVYTVIELPTILRAVKTGSFTVGPVTVGLVAEVVSANRRRNPFEQFGFSDPFGFGTEQKQLTLATDPETMVIKPLPQESVPAGFNGAIGSYTMSVSVGPTNVTAGDPITVKVAISGHGALDSLTLPDQPAWHEFKTFPPTSKLETTDKLGMQGSKTFEQIIIPENAEIKELPAIAFSYFDLEQQRYATLTEPAVKLLVKPGAAAPAPVVAVAPKSAPESPPPAQDIVHIKPRIGTLAQIGPPLIEQPWFLVLQGVPLVAFVSAFVIRKRGEMLANNPRLRRQRQVTQAVREGLEKLRGLAAEKNSDEFFATLFRLLQEQLGERLNLPATAITEAVVDEHLRRRLVSDQTLAALQETFQACNLARYSPVHSSQELSAMIPKFEALLQELRSIKS